MSDMKKTFCLDISKRNWISAKDYIVNIEPNKDVAYLLSNCELPDIAVKSPPSQSDVLRDRDEIEARVAKYKQLKDMFSVKEENEIAEKLDFTYDDVTNAVTKDSSFMSLRNGKAYNPMASKTRAVSKNQTSSVFDDFNPMQKLTSPKKELLQKYNYLVTKTEDKQTLDIRKAVGLLPSGLFLLYPDTKEGETKFKADYEKYIRQYENYEKAISVTWSKIMSEYMTIPTCNSVRTHVNFAQAENDRDLLLLWSIMKEIVDDYGSLTPTMVICKFFAINDSEYPHWDQFVNDFRSIIINMQDLEIILDDRIISTFFKLKIPKAKETLSSLATWLETSEGEEASHEEVIAKIQEIKNKKRAQMGATAMMNGKSTQSKVHYSVSNFNTGNSSNNTNSNNNNNNNKSNNYKSYPCWNCCQLGHHNKVCTQPPVTCTMCGEKGHYHFFCPRTAVDRKKAIASFQSSKSHDNNSNNANQNKDSVNKTTENTSEITKSNSYKKKFNKQVQGASVNLTQADSDDLEYGVFFVTRMESPDVYQESSNRFYIPDDYGDDINVLSDDSQSKDVASFIDSLDLHEVYFLTDDGANVHVVKDLRILPNAVELPEPKPIGGVSGSIYATHSAELPGLGKVYYCADSPENLISLVQLVEHGYTYNGTKDGVTVLDSRGEVFFKSSKISNNKLNYVNYLDIGCLLSHLYRCLANDYNIMNAQVNFSKEELSRADQIAELHLSLAHPNDYSFGKALEYTQSHLNNKDIEVWRNVHGGCRHCIQAKMKENPAYTSDSPPPHSVGDIHIDYHEFQSRVIGGYQGALIGVDRYSTMLFIMPVKSKARNNICLALDSIVNAFKGYNHSISKVTTDHESMFISVADYLETKYQIPMVNLTPGRHAKRVERYIGTIKSRMRATLIGLSYKLPSQLELELLQFVIQGINMVPNSNTNVMSPYEIFTGNKPNFQNIIPFGTPGVWKSPNVKSSSMVPAEIGISVGMNPRTPGGIRVYFPHSEQVLVRNQFIPLPNIPKEWEWRPNITKHIVNSTLAIDESANSPETIETSDIPIHSQADGGDSELLLNSIPIEEPIAEEFFQPIADPLVEETAVSISINDPISNSVDHTENTNSNTNNRASRYGRSIVKRVHKDFYYSYHTNKVSSEYTSNLNPKKLTLKNAFDGEMGPLREKARDEELTSLMKLKVFDFKKKYDISVDDRRKALHGIFILVDKYSPSGTYEKSKGRLVADGSRQLEGTYEITNAQTINAITINMALSKAVFNRSKIKVYDVPTAFLHTPMKQVVHIKLNKVISFCLVMLFPFLREFLDEDGCLWALILKCIYGTKQAAYEFSMLLSALFKSLNYIQSQIDSCYFYKVLEDGNYIDIHMHVDDLLVTASCDELFTELEECLQNKFGGLKIQEGNKLNYLGTVIHYDREKGILSRSQCGYINDILTKANVADSKPHSMPFNTAILDNEPSESCDRSEYLSLLMSLMHLARITRADIMWSVVYLASRSSNPTKRDYGKVMNIVRYLIGTKDYGISYTDVNPTSKHTLHVYVDASYMLHKDGKSHTGMFILIDDHPIFWKSSKQVLTTTSSTEAEIVALKDVMQYVVWIHDLLLDMRFMVESIIIHEDNEAAITIINDGGTFEGTKHFRPRIGFIREQIEALHAKIIHTRSKEMRADLLTKNVKEIIYLYLRPSFCIRIPGVT